MSNAAELIWGQMAAVGVAMLFLTMERRRLSWPDAAIEAFRVWGYMAVSILSIWVALQISDPILRIGVGLLAPVTAALLFNNAYVVMRRRLEHIA